MANDGSHVTKEDAQKKLPPRVVEKINFDGADGCWPWTAGVDRYGYGLMWSGGRMVLAHRFVWINLVGTIPSRYDLDHLCSNRLCTNPQHMKLTTKAT